MTASTAAEAAPEAAPSRRYYMGSVDGLRFLSFIIVFGIHLPAPAAVAPISQYGWAALDLFFSISAFLMFRLLDAEDRKDGSINLRNFYVRRVLRIYPLLIAYYLVTFIIREGFLHPMAWVRFFTTIFGVDNIASWWWGYNYTIQGVGHLWTLSYEFQIYLMIPLAFLAWKRFGTRSFVLGLLAIEVVAFGVRWFAVTHGAPQVGVYVIPYFRPESIFLGLALAAVRPSWRPQWSLVAALASLALIVTVDDPLHIWSYTAAGVLAAGLVDAAVRFDPLRKALSLRFIRYLGTISFGLYVLHVAAIWGVVRVLQKPVLHVLYGGPEIIVLALAGSFVAASLSYRYLELPFLRLKKRFTSVEGRATG